MLRIEIKAYLEELDNKKEPFSFHDVAGKIREVIQKEDERSLEDNAEIFAFNVYTDTSNGTSFKFLEESKSVAWWYKNGDAGSEFFSISYFNPDENKEKLFYPDWIFKAKDKIWIIDTKKGATAEFADTAYKAGALQEWLKGKKGLAGGIAVQDGPNGWKINPSTKYSYSPSLKGWLSIKDLL